MVFGQGVHCFKSVGGLKKIKADRSASHAVPLVSAGFGSREKHIGGGAMEMLTEGSVCGTHSHKMQDEQTGAEDQTRPC